MWSSLAKYHLPHLLPAVVNSSLRPQLSFCSCSRWRRETRFPFGGSDSHWGAPELDQEVGHGSHRFCHPELNHGATAHGSISSLHSNPFCLEPSSLLHFTNSYSVSFQVKFWFFLSEACPECLSQVAQSHLCHTLSWLWNIHHKLTFPPLSLDHELLKAGT